MPDATPIFTKRDPTTGAVLFDFSGKIQAQGIDLSGGPVSAVADVNAIEWLRDDNGNLVAAILAWQSAITGEKELYLKTFTPGLTPAAGLPTVQQQSGLNIFTTPTLGRVDVSAFKDSGAGVSRTLIGHDASSSFVQLDTTRKLNISDQFVIPLNIPAGGNQNATKNVGAIFSGEFQVVGHFDQRGGAWLDHAGWSITAVASPNITFSFFNSGAGAGVGNFAFYVIHV